MDAAFQRCIFPACGASVPLRDTVFICPKCGGLLDVAYDWSRLAVPKSFGDFESRASGRGDPLDFSGVWRFRALLPFAAADKIVTIGEGRTILLRADAVARYVGLAEGCLFLQYEGLNPSGSFKDNGMAAALTHARLVGARRAACASTGNTSASLALFAAATGLLRAIVFVGSGKIAYGKLAQALDHGALTLQIAGDFDDAMRRVQEVAGKLGLYLVNSVNPFRLEGQKTIIYRVLEALDWQAPDWIVVPGGNLGNVSAFGKALGELAELGLLKQLPRLAVINAAGANTFYELFERLGLRWKSGRLDKDLIGGFYQDMANQGKRAATVASAIEINHPVNLPKALRALDRTNGLVREVTDQEILGAKAHVGAGGLGCEPASAASVAGVKKLRGEGVIRIGERVVCILTGHALKDPTATIAYHADKAVQTANDAEQIIRAIETHS
ncbi:MAG: threonine synthase [Planctomycetes bacterium]|nr:threonine synthase [Planctomycetota bacterium]